MVRRTRIAAVLTLAMINVFTLAAGIAVARMLPPRLAALRVPTVAAAPVAGGDAVLATGPQSGPLPTANGLRAALAGPLSAAALGPQVSALVADPVTGRVLLSEHGSPAHDPRVHHEAGHRPGRPRGPRRRRQVHHQGGARGGTGQHRPGRRRRPDAGREPVPGPGLPAAGHPGQPGRGDRAGAESAGPPDRRPRLRHLAVHRPANWRPAGPRPTSARATSPRSSPSRWTRAG